MSYIDSIDNEKRKDIAKLLWPAKLEEYFPNHSTVYLRHTKRDITIEIDLFAIPEGPPQAEWKTKS